MGIFSFLKKKQEQGNNSKNNILLAMPIFNDGARYQLNKIIENLRTQWDYEIEDFAGDDEAASFSINGETIGLAYMSIPIPWDDIEGTAKYAYNWPNAVVELENHTGHAILSVMTSHNSTLERFKILSKILCSILITTECVGVYQGSQSLLIQRDLYLYYLEELEKNNAPVPLWIYMGLREYTDRSSGYTYGLKEFNKQEIEIIDSKLSLEELYNFLQNIAAYIIENDITLKTGETIGFSAEQKIAITSSKGKFVEGESLKLEI